MDQASIDVFKHYDLPFETYFNKEVNSNNQLHDESELIWVLKGNVTVQCDNKSYLMTAQTLFMINPFQVHSIHSGSDAMIITYRFKKEYIKEYAENYRNLAFVNQVQNLDELVIKYKEVPLLISQLVRLLISPNQSSLIRYKIVGYYNMFIYELYTMLLREKYLDVKTKDVPMHIERQNKIIDFLNKNFIYKITLADLAVQIGISEYRLSHLMKEMFGISFREYLFNIRYEYALRLLRETDLCVIDVAKMSGFSDIKYLNKLLQERVKTTALKYRKRFTSKVGSTVSDSNYIADFFNELRICLRNLDQKHLFDSIAL